MQSRLLIEYMRTGAITPLKKGDTKEEVEAKLGAPEDWKGRQGGFGWVGPLLTDHRDSWAWHYGSLCVTFPDAALYGVPGIRLNLGFGDPSASFHFPAPFAELPQAPFTLQDLVDLLDEHGVRHRRHRAGLWVSEGDIGIVTSDGEYSPSARVVYLAPHPYDQVGDTSRSDVRQRLIERFSEMLRQPDLPDADRIRCEESLRDLELQKGVNKE